MVEKLRALDEQLPETTHFFRKPDSEEFTVIGFRVEAQAESDALELSKHHLAGFVDGLAVILDRGPPK